MRTIAEGDDRTAPRPAIEQDANGVIVAWDAAAVPMRPLGVLPGVH